jgi:translation initiation factor IF-2
MEEPRPDAPDQSPDAEKAPQVEPTPQAEALGGHADAAPEAPQPDPTAPQQPATEAPRAEAPALDAVEASSAPAGDVPAMETAAVADAPATPDEGAEAPTAEAGAAPDASPEAGKPSLGKIKRLQEGQARRPRRGRRAGQAGGEGEGEGQQAQGAPQAGGQQKQRGGQQQRGGQGGGQGGGKRQRSKGPRGPRQPREKGPLPFDELREAARAILKQHGPQTALRDAFRELAPKERNDISALVAGDGDFRVRARSVSAGSLAAGKLGKALAAQQIAVADVKDLWPLCLSKEEAAERQAWVRNARRRDEQRAKRQEERTKRTDRISKEDMEKARDGRVGAQIRFVIAGEEKKDRAKKDEGAEKKTTAADLLDRLGY